MSSSAAAVRAAVVLAACAVLSLAQAGPSPGAPPDRNEPRTRDGLVQYSRRGALSDVSSSQPVSSDDLDRGCLEEVYALLHYDNADDVAALPFGGAAPIDVGWIRAAAAQPQALSDAPPEPVLDSERNGVLSEAETFADAVLDDLLDKYDRADHPSQSDDTVRGESATVEVDEDVVLATLRHPYLDETPESHREGKRRKREKTTTGSVSASESILVPAPESGSVTTPACSNAGAADSVTATVSAVGKRRARRSRTGRLARPYPIHPAVTNAAIEKMESLVGRVWAVIVQRGRHLNPLPIPESGAFLPIGRKGNPVGKVPRLCDHSNIDLVLSHYVAYFDPNNPFNPSGKSARADLAYRRKVEYMVNCYFYHCGGVQHTFQSRHKGHQLMRFDDWCNEVDHCNYKELSERAFHRKLKHRLLELDVPARQSYNKDLLEGRLQDLIAAKQQTVREQLATLQCCQAKPSLASRPDDAPRLCDYSCMDLVLAHYAAVFGPDGSHWHAKQWNFKDVIYRRKLALLLNCFFNHCDADYGIFYDRLGVYNRDLGFRLCYTVAECSCCRSVSAAQSTNAAAIAAIENRR